jgi:hypothetical protein
VDPTEVVSAFEQARGESALAWVPARHSLTRGALVVTPTQVAFCAVEFGDDLQVKAWGAPPPPEVEGCFVGQRLRFSPSGSVSPVSVEVEGEASALQPLLEAWGDVASGDERSPPTSPAALDQPLATLEVGADPDEVLQDEPLPGVESLGEEVPGDDDAPLEEPPAPTPAPAPPTPPAVPGPAASGGRSSARWDDYWQEVKSDPVDAGEPIPLDAGPTAHPAWSPVPVEPIEQDFTPVRPDRYARPAFQPILRGTGNPLGGEVARAVGLRLGLVAAVVVAVSSLTLWVGARDGPDRPVVHAPRERARPREAKPDRPREVAPSAPSEPSELDLQAELEHARRQAEREAEELASRVRAGDLTGEQVALAAFLGDPGAQRVAGSAVQPPPVWQQGADAQVWLSRLSRWGWSARARAAVAVLRDALLNWEAAHPDDPGPGRVVRALEAWVHQPTPPNAQRVEDEAQRLGEAEQPLVGPPLACLTAAELARRGEQDAGGDLLWSIVLQAYTGEDGSHPALHEVGRRAQQALCLDVLPWALGQGDPVAQRARTR